MVVWWCGVGEMRERCRCASWVARWAGVAVQRGRSAADEIIFGCCFAFSWVFCCFPKRMWCFLVRISCFVVGFFVAISPTFVTFGVHLA